LGFGISPDLAEVESLGAYATRLNDFWSTIPLPRHFPVLAILISLPGPPGNTADHQVLSQASHAFSGRIEGDFLCSRYLEGPDFTSHIAELGLRPIVQRGGQMMKFSGPSVLRPGPWPPF
jgi:hypothetical protein